MDPEQKQLQFRPTQKIVSIINDTTTNSGTLIVSEYNENSGKYTVNSGKRTELYLPLSLEPNY